MIISLRKLGQNPLGRRLLCLLILPFMLGSMAPATVSAQEAIFAPMPQPGMMVSKTERFVPTLLRGIMINPAEPFQLDFIVDTGQTSRDDEGLEEEKIRLIKYFMASLTVPEDDLWVNLSPFEQQRIIPEQFGLTDMGRDLLAQDYLLKQLTATLMYPEDELGQSFWDRVYRQAQAKFGTTDIPVNTFNKVWIVPEEAVIYEQGNAAYITKTHLKVMLEEDYVALDKNLAQRTQVNTDTVTEEDEVNTLASEVIRDVILPAIEDEVNNGRNFATLRQIYHSLILAAWYKESIKQSLINQLYSDQNKINGIDIDDKEAKERIYKQYIAAFEEGVYDYIKEEFDPITQEVIPRKYFSGGVRFRLGLGANVIRRTDDSSAVTGVGDTEILQIGMLRSNRRRRDNAILSTTIENLMSEGLRSEQMSSILDEWFASGVKRDFTRNVWETERSISRGLNLVAFRSEETGRLVGVANYHMATFPSTDEEWINNKVYMIDNIEVSADARESGFGTILLAEIIQRSMGDVEWEDMDDREANPGALVLTTADAAADEYFYNRGFRRLPRQDEDPDLDRDLFGSEGVIRYQNFWYLSGERARAIVYEAQQMIERARQAEQYDREVVPLYEAQAQRAEPGQQLNLFPEVELDRLDDQIPGQQDLFSDSDQTSDKAVLSGSEWERFVPFGIRENPPWAKVDAYDDFSRSMGSNANAAGRIRVFRDFMENEGIELPESFQRAAILGFGEGSTELLMVQSAFNLQEVHGVEWVGDRVRSAAESLAQSSAFPNQFALHHANMANLQNEFGAQSFDFVYAGLISDNNANAPVSIAREITRILAPGGYALIDEGNPDFVAYFETQGEVYRWLDSSYFVFQKAGVSPQQSARRNGLTTAQRSLLRNLAGLQVLSSDLATALSTDEQVGELLAQSELFNDNPLVRTSAGYRPTDTIGLYDTNTLPGLVGGLKLRTENQFYFKTLQEYAPEVVAYARNLLENPDYTGKKFVALGRGADSIYDALTALTYLDPQYAGRRGDITLVDFSSEDISDLTTAQNINAYGDMFRRQLTRQLGVSTLDNIVFVNEVASEANATQLLLQTFLDVPFEYTAAVQYDNIQARSGMRYDGSRDTTAFDWLDTNYRSGRAYQIQAFPVFGLGHQYAVQPFQRFLNQETIYSEVFRQTRGAVPVLATGTRDNAILSVNNAEWEGIQSTLQALQTIAQQLESFVTSRELQTYQARMDRWNREATAVLAEVERTGEISERVGELEQELIELGFDIPKGTADDLKPFTRGPTSFMQMFRDTDFSFFDADSGGILTQTREYAVYDYIDKLNKALMSAIFAVEIAAENMGGTPLENIRLAQSFTERGARDLDNYFALLSDTLNPMGIDRDSFKLGLEKDAFPETVYNEFLLPYGEVVVARRTGTVDGAVLASTYVMDAAGFLGVDADIVRASLTASIDGETGLQRFARQIRLEPVTVLDSLVAAGFVQRNAERGELGFDFTEAFFIADAETQFLIAGRGEKNYLFEFTRFMLEELNEPTFQAELTARGVDLEEDAIAERIRESEREGVLPLLLGMLRRSPTSVERFPEQQMEQANDFSRVLQNILAGANVSRETQKRNRLLNELGDEIQEIARDVLDSPNLRISISALGSTLRGYADVDSDIEYKIHILSGLEGESVGVLDDARTLTLYQRVNALINEVAQRRGETYFADDKFIGQSPTVNWEFILSTGVEEYMDNYRRTMPSDPQLFLPQVYGDTQTIERTRATFIAHTDSLADNELNDFSRVRWSSLRDELIQTHMLSARVDSPALDRMQAQAGITTATEYEDWLYARYSLPNLDAMREIYGEQIAALEQASSLRQPALEPQLLEAYEAYVDQMGKVLSELQKRRAGDQVWFIYDNQYWDKLPARAMAIDRRTGDFLIHLHTSEGDLTRGFMFRINPDAQPGEAIFDKFWIEDNSVQGFIEDARFVEAGYITADFAQQLLDDATAVMRQDDGFPIMDRYRQMRQDFYPLMQDVIANRPESVAFEVGAVQDARQQDVLINIFRPQDTGEADAEGILPRTFFGPANESYEVSYKVTSDAATLSANPVGGIDLTPNNLNIEVRRDPNGVPVPLTPQQIQDVNIDGLYPVIINTIPVTNVPLLLGIADQPDNPTDLSQKPDAIPVSLPAEPDRLSLLR